MKWRKPHTPCKLVLHPLWVLTSLFQHQHLLWAGNRDVSCLSPLSVHASPDPPEFLLSPWPDRECPNCGKALVSRPSLPCNKAFQSQVSVPQSAAGGVRALSGRHTCGVSTALLQEVTIPAKPKSANKKCHSGFESRGREGESESSLGRGGTLTALSASHRKATTSCLQTLGQYKNTCVYWVRGAAGVNQWCSRAAHSGWLVPCLFSE